MASLYHSRYSSGQISRYWNLRCYRCGRHPLNYPDGSRVANRRDALHLKAQHELRCRPKRAHSLKTFGQLMEAYLEATQHRRQNPKSQEDDNSKLIRLKQSLGTLPIRAITTCLLESTLNQLVNSSTLADANRMTPRTIGLSRRDRYLQFLRSTCHWAVQRGYLLDDPTQGLPKLSTAKSRVHLPVELWGAFLLLAKPSKYYPAVLLTLTTGIRPSELKRLLVHDFTLDHALVRIRAEVSKTKQERMIELTEEVVEVLRKVLPKTGQAFLIYFPQLQRQVRKWLEHVGISGSQLGLYTLRHGFITELVKHVDIFEAMRIAGHTNPKTTLSYVHPTSTPEHANWISSTLLRHTENGTH